MDIKTEEILTNIEISTEDISYDNSLESRVINNSFKKAIERPTNINHNALVVYLKEIAKTPLLKSDEEIKLAKIYTEGRNKNATEGQKRAADIAKQN